MLENVDSGDTFAISLLESPLRRSGLNVPFLETNSVAIRPSGGVSRSALVSLIDMLQVLKCAGASLR